MSYQKRHVSAGSTYNPKSSRSSTRTHRRRHHDYDRYDDARRRHHEVSTRRKREREFEEESSTSFEDHPKQCRRSSRKSSSIHSADSQLLALRLQEIELLRHKIVELEDTVSSYERSASKHTSLLSCFSFLNGSTKKKNSTLDVYNSKISFDPTINDQFHSDGEQLGLSEFSITKQKMREDKKRRKEKENYAKQHRITNNNTIVLPEGYGMAQPQNSSELMAAMASTIEEHGNEIQEIKLRLNQCIELLRAAPSFDNTGFPCKQQIILDEYIKVNATLSSRKFGNLFANSIDNGMIYMSHPGKSALPLPSIENVGSSIVNSETYVKPQECVETALVDTALPKVKEPPRNDKFAMKLTKNKSKEDVNLMAKCNYVHFHANTSAKDREKCECRDSELGTSCFLSMIKCIFCQP